jgi:hypothetical protein
VTEYIEFIELKSSTKTRQFLIKNLTHGLELGVIKWHAGWRQYCFFPLSQTVWSDGCLQAVQDKLRELKRVI